MKNYLLLFGVSLIWGSQFIVQDVAILEIPPAWVGVSRTVIGCFTLIAICSALGLRSENSSWSLIFTIGLLEATIPFSLIPWGQQFLASSIAAILMGAVPFFTIVFAPLLLRNSAISAIGIVSVLMGLVGLVLLFLPDLSGGTILVDPKGAAAILLAAASFSLALLFLKQLEHEHPLIVARNVLGMASIQIVVLALFISPVPDLKMSPQSAGALAYLGIMCAGVVYVMYMSLIRSSGPVFASMTSYLIPAVGVLLGATLNSEAISFSVILALIVILAAIGVYQRHGSNT